MDYFNAFWFGGLICALIQILLDKTKLMPGRVMVLLVCSGAVLSAVGIYKPLVDFAGAGASVPLIGFGHVLWEGMKKAIEEDGILGLFTGGFTACAAGVSSALIFSYLASFFFRPKIKVKRIVSEKIVWYNREQMRKCKNNRCFKDRCKNGKIRGILRWLFGNCASQNRIERR